MKKNSIERVDQASTCCEHDANTPGEQKKRFSRIDQVLKHVVNLTSPSLSWCQTLRGGNYKQRRHTFNKTLKVNWCTSRPTFSNL